MTSRNSLEVPPEIEAVFREFHTCEMSALARDGTPITWPTLPFWRPEEGRFLITTSIGLPHKAFNIRRTPRVSLLVSDPTASGPEARQRCSFRAMPRPRTRWSRRLRDLKRVKELWA